MKKILKYLTNRLFIVGVMILLQVGWIIVLLFNASLRFRFVSFLIKALSLFIIVSIVTKWSNPSIKLSWIVLILVVPIVGVPVYLLFGRSNLTKSTRLRMDEVTGKILPYLPDDTKTRAQLREIDHKAAIQSDYLKNAANAPLYQHTHTRYFSSGEKMFESMLEDIRKAKHSIFLEFFIFDQGVMYDQLFDELAKKAAQGVDVRMIYDDIGSITRMPAHFYRDLQKKHIKCAAFNPARPILSIFMNHRDHRKLMVIDGLIAYTGGANIADEYINVISPHGYWKDAAIRLEGAAAGRFLLMFFEMWRYIVDIDEDYRVFLPSEEVLNAIDSDGFVQPYGDTPLDHENTGENVYLNMINRAEHYVYMYTPYLILDQELMVALCNAAKSGVDVRLVTPGIPDKKMVYKLTRAHYRKLLDNGVRIYEYSPGFLHSKCFLSDDSLATVGSINMDYRSLYLHFECGAWMYGSEAVMQLKEDMLEVFQLSRERTVLDCSYRYPLLGEILQAMLRLLAPLL